MAQYIGDYSAPAGGFAIVAARFNSVVTESLVAGCRDSLERHGVPEASIDVAWVPGSFEIPLVARKLAATGRYVAIVCLGCVIRGETSHYDHVAGQAAAGVMNAAMSGLKSGNKGAEAAMAAIEMVNLLARIES
jgi:6,7-dimethyl-8-ribityllumazine synthase